MMTLHERRAANSRVLTEFDFDTARFVFRNADKFKDCVLMEAARTLRLSPFACDAVLGRDWLNARGGRANG